MSLSRVFVKVKCEQKVIINYYMPKPSHHPKNKDVVIISTDYWEEQNGIYEYNIKNNTFNKIYTYDKTFEPYDHGQFIDEKNELLYIFGREELGIFDLNTKIMNTNTKSVLRNIYCRYGPQSTYIPSTINETH
eukprot:66828_1